MQAANKKRTITGSRILLAFFCCVAATVAAAQSVDAQLITIGAVSGQLGPDGAGRAVIFSNYLDSQLPGNHFQVIPFDTIEALTAAVDARNIKFAFVTPVAFVQLSQRHLLRPMATVTQQVNGQLYPWLASSVFVRADRLDLLTLHDAKRRKVTAFSPTALGGWLAALRELRNIGIRESDLTELHFAFANADIVKAVCDQQTDIGVLPASTFLRLRSDCAAPLRVLKLPTPFIDSRFPVDSSSHVYPEIAFAQIGIENEALVSKLTIALLSMQPGSDESKAINIAGFTAPLEYSAVADLMKELQVAPFDGFGEITISQFVQQHRGSLAIVMFVIAGILVLAYARNNRLQRKVRQSELFRNQIFSRSQFAVLVFDANTRHIVDINSVAIKLLGYSCADELIGKNPLAASAQVQYDSGKVREGIEIVLDQLEFDQNPLVTQWLMRRPNGELWDAEGHMVPFTYGNDRFIQVTLVDITERKRIIKERERMEQHLQHSQRLESIGRFSGAIAHDFNNLLTVINGYSELLLLNAEQDDKQMHVYREISQACSRAGQLTNQLLTFSRRRMIRMEALDVNRIIAESVSMFGRLLGETVSLHTTLCSEDTLTLADSGQLHQVLMNFVANAKDAMPDGGKLEITTRLCQVEGAQASQLNLESGAFIMLQVSDNGIGMSQDVQSKIFEPFFTTKGERGTGFGLATAYGIIKQCKGSITFHSEPDVGTTFTLYLPVTTVKLATPPPKPTITALPGNGPRTVLVVEDEHDVRSFACLLLQNAGITVIECDSGMQALELAKAHAGEIDLLFTDVVLGDISGIKLAEQFQRLFPATPVLFTSGYANDELALGEIIKGRTGFIAKPYSPATLLVSIKTLFEEHPVLAL